MITVAPTGAETAKADAPSLPVTLAELVRTARACADIGASVVHVHIRDAETRPTLDLGRLTETVAALREATDLVVQLSTGGAVTDPEVDRLRASAAGHLRVGMEDTLTYGPGAPVRDNAQLVARAAGLARIAQRPPATPAETREVLGIRSA